jgi:hypothetical protein
MPRLTHDRDETAEPLYPHWSAQADQFFGELVRAGRNRAPGLLFDAWIMRRISRDTLAAMLPEVWSVAEYPERALAPRWAWLSLFKAANYTEGGQPAPRPTAPCRLYRGCPPAWVRHMSWTDDLAVARRFAYMRSLGWPDDLKRQCNVYATDAPADALLCKIGGRGAELGGRSESDYVVDPAKLGKV